MPMLIQGRVARVEAVDFVNQATGEAVSFERAYLYDGSKVHALRLPEGVHYPVDARLAGLMQNPEGQVTIPVDAREYKGVTTYRHAEPATAAPAAPRS